MKKFFLVLLTATISFAANAEESNVSKKEIQRSETIARDSIRPQLSLKSKDGKFSVTASGYVNLRASYDFNGSIINPDFITSLIDVTDAYNTQRRFYFDATTSRIEVKGKAETEKLGDVELCLNMDFRAGDAGSYTPRLRLAYVAFKGFMFGRNYTTFSDVTSISPNIDFQGPNVCPFIYTTQIRYVKPFESGLTLGAAVEYIDYTSSSLGDESESSPSGQTFCYQEKFIPDFVGYLQYKWGEDATSHIRMTGLYKSIPLYNTVSQSNVNLNGWGMQLSGSLGLSKNVTFYYSGTCGEGISNYMQDTYGSGLDATVSSGSAPEASLTPMYGWQVSTLVQLSSRVMASVGYSAVEIKGNTSKYAADDYKKCDYAFANVFYSLTPRVQLAAEYLWGQRTNFSGDNRSANRINTMLQYNF